MMPIIQALSCALSHDRASAHRQQLGKHKVNRLEYHYIKHHVTQGSRGYNIAKQDRTHSKQFWYLHERGLM